MFLVSVLTTTRNVHALLTARSNADVGNCRFIAGSCEIESPVYQWLHVLVPALYPIFPWARGSGDVSRFPPYRTTLPLSIRLRSERQVEHWSWKEGIRVKLIAAGPSMCSRMLSIYRPIPFQSLVNCL